MGCKLPRLHASGISKQTHPAVLHPQQLAGLVIHRLVQLDPLSYLTVVQMFAPPCKIINSGSRTVLQLVPERQGISHKALPSAKICQNVTLSQGSVCWCAALNSKSCNLTFLLLLLPQLQHPDDPNRSEVQTSLQCDTMGQAGTLPGY